MSEPRNHHYVSQVLIRKFLDNKGKAYFYDKNIKSIEKLKSTRNFFSETDLNSTIKNGKIDHSSIEESLNKNFETKFNTHYNRVVGCVKAKNFDKLDNSDIESLIKFGIIGAPRHPIQRESSQETILNTIKEISKLATIELKKEIDDFEKSVSGVKNKIPLDFKEVADKTLEIMGDCVFSIFEAGSNSFFFLPDCTSITRRDLIENTLCEPIFESSHEKIVCEDKNYLENFIKTI